MQVQLFEAEVMATVPLVIFEPSFERVHLSLGGSHPPPMLAMPPRG
jgi:hypothetical protein